MTGTTDVPPEGDPNVEEPNILGRNPVLVYAAIQAAITLAVTFGLRWTPEQIGAVLVFTGAVLSLVVRSKVTPA